MVYGICERKGFISIIGEVGTGKTTLIRQLLDTLRNKKVQTVFLYQTVITFDQLLREILLELDIPIRDESKTSMIRQLNEYLIQRLARNENVALIIDEAQNLDRQVLEELRLLSNLETNSCKLIQILLVGQPELEAKLSSPELRQLKQRISIGRKIRPLNAEESRPYIEHRLGLVGSSISKVFKREALSLICDYARGIPRNINMLCDNAFLIGYGLAQKKIDASIVQEAIKDMGLSAAEKPVAQKVTLRRRQMVHRNYHRPWSAYSQAALLIFLILLLSLAFFLGREFIKATPSKLEAMTGEGKQRGNLATWQFSAQKKPTDSIRSPEAPQPLRLYPMPAIPTRTQSVSPPFEKGGPGGISEAKPTAKESLEEKTGSISPIAHKPVSVNRFSRLATDRNLADGN
jgi:general secretion pathway protein A